MSACYYAQVRGFDIVGQCPQRLAVDMSRYYFAENNSSAIMFAVQFMLNGGRPVAQSIPATEHSVMTSWPTEQAAIENMIEHFGSGLFACVMDSYDYQKALSEVGLNGDEKSLTPPHFTS
jgi:hypothetical protein